MEVYNCATGSADCSQCLGREDLGHRCVWSESSSSCRLSTESPQPSDVCPAPEIKKVRRGGARRRCGAEQVLAVLSLAGSCAVALTRGEVKTSGNYSLSFFAVESPENRTPHSKIMSLMTRFNLLHDSRKNNNSTVKMY